MIRLLEKKDNEAIRQIIQSSLKEYGLNIPGTAYFDPQLDDLFSFYGQTDKAAYWVVESADTIAGGAGIAPFHGNEDIAELQKLYIGKQYRGNGFCSLLLEQAVHFARQHYPAVYIETSNVLDLANSIYVKFGFCQLKKPLQGTEHSAMNRWYLLEF